MEPEERETQVSIVRMAGEENGEGKGSSPFAELIEEL
jgi:hypothetical protein